MWNLPPYSETKDGRNDKKPQLRTSTITGTDIQGGRHGCGSDQAPPELATEPSLLDAQALVSGTAGTRPRSPHRPPDQRLAAPSSGKACLLPRHNPRGQQEIRPKAGLPGPGRDCLGHHLGHHLRCGNLEYHREDSRNQGRRGADCLSTFWQDQDRKQARGIFKYKQDAMKLDLQQSLGR